MDWNRIGVIAKESFRDGVTGWIKEARISSGGTVIHGSTLTLLSPCIGNNFDLQAFLMKSMRQAGMPAKLVEPLAEALADAWKSWPGTFAGTLPGVFPSLAAVPAPFAPPALAVPLPFRIVKIEDRFMRAPALLVNLTRETRPLAKSIAGNFEDAMRTLANWVDRSFQNWMSHVLITGLVGDGPVPSFAPPVIPMGPVVGGKARSNGLLFSGGQFGTL